MTRFICPAVLLAALTFTGCGPAATDLTGKVTYQGKPVVFGSVVVIDASGTTKSGTIQPDGTYRVDNVRVGAVKVAVSSPPPPGTPPVGKQDPRDASDKPTEPPPAAPPEVLKNWVAIPNKYGDPNESGLTGAAKSGQPLNLDLK